MKKLYRSEEDKVIAGIIGGIGEYLDIDAVLLRVIAIVIAVVTGIVPFALIYLLSIFVVPRRPGTSYTVHEHE